jgi:predicted nucleotidyltransferase
LKRFRATVSEICGGQVERVVLFGSRARGGAREDLEYDVAVLLRDYTPGSTTELDRLADRTTVILDETGEFIHAMPYRAGSFNERTPLMHEIRAQGIDCAAGTGEAGNCRAPARAPLRGALFLRGRPK